MYFRTEKRKGALFAKELRATCNLSVAATPRHETCKSEQQRVQRLEAKPQLAEPMKLGRVMNPNRASLVQRGKTELQMSQYDDDDKASWGDGSSSGGDPEEQPWTIAPEQYDADGVRIQWGLETIIEQDEPSHDSEFRRPRFPEGRLAAKSADYAGLRDSADSVGAYAAGRGYSIAPAAKDTNALGRPARTARTDDDDDITKYMAGGDRYDGYNGTSQAAFITVSPGEQSAMDSYRMNAAKPYALKPPEPGFGAGRASDSVYELSRDTYDRTARMDTRPSWSGPSGVQDYSSGPPLRQENAAERPFSPVSVGAGPDPRASPSSSYRVRSPEVEERNAKRTQDPDPGQAVQIMRELVRAVVEEVQQHQSPVKPVKSPAPTPSPVHYQSPPIPVRRALAAPPAYTPAPQYQPSPIKSMNMSMNMSGMPVGLSDKVLRTIATMRQQMGTPMFVLVAVAPAIFLYMAAANMVLLLLALIAAAGWLAVALLFVQNQQVKQTIINRQQEATGTSAQRFYAATRSRMRRLSLNLF
eukprot:jgi/Chlat1/8955/Chrsp94S00695